MSGSRDTAGGWYPSATPVNIPVTNFAHGHTSREAAVLHIIVGSQGSARSKFQNPASETSSHFSISRAGRVEQYVSVLDTAYGNGLSWNGQYWVDPQKVVLKPPKPAPSWAGLRPPTNPNFQTISIEHEGLPTDVPTTAMALARTALLRWLGTQFPSLRVYTPHQNLIGHNEISPYSKANCPGPHFDLTAIAAAGSQAARVYRVIGLPVYQRQDLTGALAGHLDSGAHVAIDQTYPNGAGHLDSGLGFVDLDGLGEP